jgi:hypothetical protein
LKHSAIKIKSNTRIHSHWLTFLLGILMISQTMPLMAQMLEPDPVLEEMKKPPITSPSPPTQKKTESKSQSPKITLKGNITTLDTALIQEADTVDWYGWYMGCRKYLILTGGIQCPVGTKIRFNRGGLMTPYSNDSDCIQSVLSKRFPLPTNTKLEGIILPVRSSRVPPASPQELYNLLKGP